MYAAPGVGLAATQVNVHRRVLVADVSREQDQPLAFVNPEIIEREGKTEAEEGCLSVPGIFDKLNTRSERVVVRALDCDGKPFDSRPTACWPCAYSTRWITWRASCSWITCPSSSAAA